MKEKQSKLENIVNSIHKLIELKENDIARGRTTLRLAKADLYRTIKALRYDNDNYIWVHNYAGEMVIHPIKPELEGIATSEWDEKKGMIYIQEMTSLVRKKGKGFIKYQWCKPGGQANKVYPKLSYVKGYPQWGWIIGSGVYIDDINKLINQVMLLVSAYCITAFGVLSLFFNSAVAKSITNPIKNLSKISLKLAKNDYNIEIPCDTNNTEIGELNRAFKEFLQRLKYKQSILESISSSVIITDKSGIIQDYNLSDENFFDYTQQEVIGININFLIPNLTDNFTQICENKKINTVCIKQDCSKFNAEVTIKKADLNGEISYTVFVQALNNAIG